MPTDVITKHLEEEMTRAEAYKEAAKVVSTPPVFCVSPGGSKVFVDKCGDLAFYSYAYGISAKDIPAFIEWLRNTFIYDDAPF